MIHKKTSMRIVLLFCIFMYPVMLNGPVVLSYAYQYGIPFIYVISNIRYIKRLNSRQLAILGMAAFLVALSVMYPLIHNTGDYSYIKVTTYVFRKLVVYLLLVIVIIKKYRKDSSIECFMYYFSLTNAIFVVGTLMLVFIPGLKNTWFLIFKETIKSESYLKSFGYTFRIGWQGFAGYRMTFHCTLSCIFLLYLNYSCEERYRLKKVVFFLTFALCLLGNMFYGRSGLVLSILTSIFCVLFWNITHFTNILKFICLASVIIIVVYLLRKQPVFSSWYIWMSTPIKNLITQGSFNNVSFSTTQSMLFMPEWSTILFGDGYFTQDGHYYMSTDSGMMRNILFWGILGAGISYGITIGAIGGVRKRNFVLWLMMITTFIAFEWKGDIYYEYITLFLAISFVENVSVNKANKHHLGVLSEKQIIKGI